MEELDWSAGQIMAALQRLDLDRNTLVIWTSDNGAPERNPPQGSNRPMGGAGYTVAEGGMRVPGIVRWPGRVPPGTTSEEMVTLMDLLPTLAALTGGKLSERNAIDGKNIWPLLAGTPGAQSPHAAFYYYMQEQLQALRSGGWKLYLPLEKRRARSGKTESGAGAAQLFDVVNDPGEKQNVVAAHAEVVSSLLKLADIARAEIGDFGRPGRGQRPAGWVADPQPMRLP